MRNPDPLVTRIPPGPGGYAEARPPTSQGTGTVPRSSTFTSTHCGAAGAGRYLNEDVQRWDSCSPQPGQHRAAPAGVPLPGEIAETGYPRNDILLGPRRAEIRDAVRRHFGIPPGATVVLYAPMWRDDVLDAGGRQDFSLQLDLDEFTRRLGSVTFRTSECR